MDIPEDLRYSSDHEWARVEGGEVRVGITDYAQDALGDVVFVELPEVGATVSQVNAELGDNPERLNDDPYGDGWICVLRVADPNELETLLDPEGYRALISEG